MTRGTIVKHQSNQTSVATLLGAPTLMWVCLLEGVTPTVAPTLTLTLVLWSY